MQRRAEASRKKAYERKFRERSISRCRSFLVAQKPPEKKLFAFRVGAYAVRRMCITFSSAHLISAWCGSLLFFSLCALVDSIAFLFMRLTFSAHPEHRAIRSQTSHRVRERSLVYSIKDGFSSPIFFLVALGYTLCAVLARLIVFQKSHADDDRDILVWVLEADVDFLK